MYLPLFIIIDVIFVWILAELLSQEDKYLLKEKKTRKTQQNEHDAAARHLLASA